MKLLFQWTLRNPTDWREIDSSAFAALPRRAEPNPGQTGDNNTQLGWLHALNVQGILFAGCDHYHVSEAGEAVVVTVWNDDPVDFPPGTRHARVWTFLPPAPDPLFGGQVNTRQSQVVHTENQLAFLPAAQNTTVLPWAVFAPPANPIHGIWVSDAKEDEHRAVRSARGWREWAA